MTKKYFVSDNKLHLNKGGFTFVELRYLSRAITLYEKIEKLKRADDGVNHEEDIQIMKKNFYDAMVEHFTDDKVVKKCFSGNENYSATHAYECNSHQEIVNLGAQVREQWKKNKTTAFQPNEAGMNPFEKAMQDYVCIVEAIKTTAMERVNNPGFGNRAGNK